MQYGLDKGYLIDAAVSQYHCVKLASQAHVTPVDTLGDAVWGIAGESATSGDVANGKIINVRRQGIARVVLGGTLAAGAKVRAGADGRVVALAGTGNENVVGILETGGVANDHADCLLTPGLTNYTAP